MKDRMRVLVAMLIALGVLVAAPAGAAGTLTVTAVRSNGGQVTVEGTASLGATPAALVQRKLVADAGDSAFLSAGENTTLFGTAWGGKPPYTFSWSSPIGTLEGKDSPTAILQTGKTKPGDYLMRLTVTDALGNKATDTVKLFVFGGTTEKLLDEDVADPTPGVTGLTVEIPFKVPERVFSFDVRVTWDNPANDYDLTIVDPEGNTTSGSGGSAGEPEVGTVTAPIPGEWTLSMDKFATVGDTLHALVDASVGPADPRPAVDAGGPYRFLIGTAQKLNAKVSGGTAPVKVGWDTDSDGVVDTNGTDVTLKLPEGRHLVTVRAVDSRGMERRQTTSVLVATERRLSLDTAAVTVIGISDSGINPYHLEYAASTYPDPDVLALTANFTKHPSEYIPGYPADSQALPVTLGKGYLPKEDLKIWDGNNVVKPGKLYWIPGTKIIGAMDAGGPAADDQGPHPILDDDGHGTGSTTVSTGNRYGYCPTCLLMFVEGLNVGIKEAFPWVDISSNSFGPGFGLPTGLLFGGDQASKAAVERGQVVLFSAGNGVGNFFDVPQIGWGEGYNGMPWNISVGALRRDNQRAVFGDAIPQHISSWGDGNLPSACRTGVVSHCAFGGTSAASPYTAGVFGTVLSEVRRVLGDVRAGQRPGQVVAQGVPVKDSPFLEDGKLTRQELTDVVLKTAQPLNQGNIPANPYAHPVWTPYAPLINVLFEGYGAATPESARRAIDVLLGRAEMPDRSFEDQFFAVDDAIKNALYGGFDRDGDGKEDSASIPNFSVNRRQVATFPQAMLTIKRGLQAYAKAQAAKQPARNTVRAAGEKPLTYYFHRLFSDPEITPTDETPGLLPPIPPGLGVFIPSTTTVECSEDNNVFFMDLADTPGDLDPCFNQRTSSVIANFRPLAIFPSSKPIDAPIPSGSRVDVELYMAAETPSIVLPAGVLVATDREIGGAQGSPLPLLPTGINGAFCDALGSSCWTKYTWSFETTRPAFTNEEITLQIQLVGARSWAFGYEGDHASKITITPAPMPATGLDFGLSFAPGSGTGPAQSAFAGGTVKFPDLGTDPTGAGDHPVRRYVQVSIDDPTFANAIEAFLDEKAGMWSIALGNKVEPGSHRIYARAAMDRTYSPVASTVMNIAGNTLVQWQVTSPGQRAVPGAWKTASGFSNWSFSFSASSDKVVYVRVLAGGVEVQRRTVRVKGAGFGLPATGVGGFGTAGLLLLLVAAALGAWRRFGRQRSGAA